MPDEQTPSSSHSDSHRLKLTPEQRRVLGPARTRQDWHISSGDVGESDAPASPADDAPTSSVRVPNARERADEPQPAKQMARPRPRISRVFQAQNVALFFAGLILLLAVFYLGKKFDYIRYELLARIHAPKAPEIPNRFPNLSADELVEQALIDQKLHNWRQAAEKLISAKRKNLAYPGLLYQAGKLYYDNNDFDMADALFDRSVAFRENAAEANYLRGMIASGRGDYAAAQQFFDAAAAANAFSAQYFYSSAEALRRQHRPAESIGRYQQAALRGNSDDELVCQFKMRISAIEAGEAARISADLDKRNAAGPLTVDWIMTQAALAIQAGRIADAVAAIDRARDMDAAALGGRFASCAGDRFFIEAANTSPKLADALRVSDNKAP